MDTEAAHTAGAIEGGSEGVPVGIGVGVASGVDTVGVGVATEGVEGLEAIEGMGILGDVGGLTVEGSNIWMAIKI